MFSSTHKSTKKSPYVRGLISHSRHGRMGIVAFWPRFLLDWRTHGAVALVGRRSCQFLARNRAEGSGGSFPCTVGKTMSFLPPMTGNGKFIPPIFGNLGDGLLLCLIVLSTLFLFSLWDDLGISEHGEFCEVFTCIYQQQWLYLMGEPFFQTTFALRLVVGTGWGFVSGDWQDQLQRPLQCPTASACLGSVTREKMVMTCYSHLFMNSLAKKCDFENWTLFANNGDVENKIKMDFKNKMIFYDPVSENIMVFPVYSHGFLIAARIWWLNCHGF